jgi:hypothetical protein
MKKRMDVGSPPCSPQTPAFVKSEIKKEKELEE